jgi:hypothetical protein
VTDERDPIDRLHLSADKNKDASEEREDAGEDADSDSGEGDDADTNQVNREQKHTDVFGEVHIVDLAMFRQIRASLFADQNENAGGEANEIKQENSGTKLQAEA